MHVQIYRLLRRKMRGVRSLFGTLPFVTAANFSGTEVTGVTLRTANYYDITVANIHAIQAVYTR